MGDIENLQPVVGVCQDIEKSYFRLKTVRLFIVIIFFSVFPKKKKNYVKLHPHLGQKSCVIDELIFVYPCEPQTIFLAHCVQAPDPEKVRPEHILRLSLRNVKKRWEQDRNYHYASDQLRSIRQDLVVRLLVSDIPRKNFQYHFQRCCIDLKCSLMSH